MAKSLSALKERIEDVWQCEIEQISAAGKVQIRVTLKDTVDYCT